MTEAIGDRVRRYILDGTDEDPRRLLGVAETTREMARSAFRRVGMQEGRCLPVTSTSLARQRRAARSTWLIRGFS